MAAQLRFVRKMRHSGRVFENGSIFLAEGVGPLLCPQRPLPPPSKGGKIPLSRHCAESTENMGYCAEVSGNHTPKLTDLPHESVLVR